jgi:hypothetical protein
LLHAARLGGATSSSAASLEPSKPVAGVVIACRVVMTNDDVPLAVLDTVDAFLFPVQ